MSASPFRHLAPALRTFYGAGCLDQLAAELKRSGCRRAVIVSGRTLAAADPGAETVEKALGDLCVGVFAGVVEHSPVAAVEAGARALRDLDADAVVVLGGGSAIVTARAASILLAEGKPAEELCTIVEPGRPAVSPKLDKPKLSQFIVPTTPTTAYAKAGAAVKSGDGGRRLALFDPKVRAQAIFFDPRLFAAAPAKLARDAGLDAFALAIQGLESLRREPLADALLLHGLRLIRRNLAKLDETPDAEDVRGELMLAALMVGQGSDFTSAGAASAIGHTIGAARGVANGLANAVVLPHTVRFNGPATVGRLADAVEAIAGRGSTRQASDSEALGDACAAFFAELGLPSRLQDLGVTPDEIPQIAEQAATDFFFSQNPRPMKPDELLALLTAAW